MVKADTLLHRCERAGVQPFIHVGRHVNELKDPFCTGDTGLHHVIYRRKFPDRVQQHGQGQQQGQHLAPVELTAVHPLPGHEEEEGHADDEDELGHGAGGGVEAYHLVEKLAETGDFRPDPTDFVVFHGEDLDDGNAVDGFVHDGGHAGDLFQGAADAFPHLHPDLGQDKDHRGQTTDANEGEHGVRVKGESEEADRLHGLAHDLDEYPFEAPIDHKNVIGKTGQHIARGAGFKEPHRLGHEIVVHIARHLGGDIGADGPGKEFLQESRNTDCQREDDQQDAGDLHDRETLFPHGGHHGAESGLNIGHRQEGLPEIAGKPDNGIT